MTASPALHGRFVTDDDGETWYRLDGIDAAPPFFTVLAGDNDCWAFVSSAGSLAAGRHDAEGAFLPYETVDRIHARWPHTGPRTWIRTTAGALWEPFARHPGQRGFRRSMWKNLSSSRIRFREEHPAHGLGFEQEWFTSAEFGLVRSARLWALPGAAPQAVQVLDGVLGLQPPGVGTLLSQTMSCLAHAYTWNEALAAGRLALVTLYAQVWDRPEPRESFHALVAWHAGAPAGTRMLLSAHQVDAFARGEPVQAETLTRGRPGAFLLCFDTTAAAEGQTWHQVIDGPRTQVEVDALARRLAAGGGTPEEIVQARRRNAQGLDELLARADGLQDSGDAMAAAHHRANVLFNIMRGGVFVDGPHLDRDDLLAFATQRHRPLGALLRQAAAQSPAQWPARLHREQALQAAAALGPQAERLVMAYLPLTFSRRHGDPSRPWNKITVRVRDAQGRRVVDHQGNWRDIFQNWEALVPSEPAWVGSMIATFVGAMTPAGHNPYRIGRDGIDWETVEPDDPWSHIGYWGDHQVVYLLRLLEAAQAQQPGLLDGLWDRALFGFADVPYRLKPHAEQLRTPKQTIDFDAAAHERAHARKAALGGDGLLVCDDAGEPVLGTLGEKLATIVLAKAGTLLPGGGLWLHTQRPEWNDANNALAGYGLSVVTLAHLRRFLDFIAAWPGAAEPFALPQATLQALQGLQALAQATPVSAVDDATARRRFLDAAGALLDPWRAQAYAGAAARTPARAPAGLLHALAAALRPLVAATLQRCRRPDGLFDTYNLAGFHGDRAEVSRLYPMLEGQVAVLSSGLLGPAEAVALLDALFASPLYTPDRDSFLLYPDRALPGFLARNRLDDAALAEPVVQRLLAAGRSDLLQRQDDGTVRFAATLVGRDRLEAAAADLGEDLPALVAVYERVLGHHAFTGRSGTMFGYEGLGCIYWHMVAKLLLAVQEQAFAAADADPDDPAVPALCAHYRRVRDGLGYKRGAAAFGAFPADPYSHTAGEGGAQQPGMTGQVKEEILTRWGELGLRMQHGLARFQPLLLDAAEIPDGGALRFTWRRIPCTWRRGTQTTLRVRTAAGWTACPDLRFDPQGVTAIEASVAFAAQPGTPGFMS